MGRFLTIGLTTGLYFKSEEAEKAFGDVHKAIEYVEQNYAPGDLYEVLDFEKIIYFKLKDKVLETELIDFLTDFYAERLANSTYKEQDDILPSLSKVKTAKEFIAVAREKRWEHYQLDPDWDYIYVDLGHWKEMRLYAEGIDLSLDGKIIMECYYEILNYFTFVLRERYKKYALSNTLRVTITG